MKNIKIPKKIHLSWKTKDILKSDSKLIAYGVKRLIDLNLDWEYEIHTDEEVEDYLKKVLSKTDYDLIADEHIVPKTDIWRLLKLYNEGGLYVDIDRFCNVNLTEVIDENAMCVLSICRLYDFSQDLMITCPQNPIFLTAIEMNLHHRRNGIKNVYLLGPQTYMHAITHNIYGNIVNTDPGKDFFYEFEKDVKTNYDFIQVYMEEIPYKTFLYRNAPENELNEDIQSLKLEFYKQNNVKHWTED